MVQLEQSSNATSRISGGSRWCRDREDVVGIDASILMHPNVWVASGHVDSFTDPLSECKECHRRHRADMLEGDVCPECSGELSEPRHFNLMFRTNIGPVEGDENIIYLRPETGASDVRRFR